MYAVPINSTPTLESRVAAPVAESAPEPEPVCRRCPCHLQPSPPLQMTPNNNPAESPEGPNNPSADTAENILSQGSSGRQQDGRQDGRDSQAAHDDQRHRVVVDPWQRGTLDDDRHQPNQGRNSRHQDRSQAFPAPAHHGFGPFHAATPIGVDVLQHDDAVVDDDTDQKKQAYGSRLVKVCSRQITTTRR